MNQIRFSVYDGDKRIHLTDWFPEGTHNDAPNALTETKKRLGGNYAYRIERTGDSKEPNRPKMVRYRIKVGESLLYSRLLTEDEKGEALIQIREQFPTGEITEVAI